MNKEAVLNAAEIMAETECERIMFRPANELKEAMKRVVRSAYIAGYNDAQKNFNNLNK